MYLRAPRTLCHLEVNNADQHIEDLHHVKLHLTHYFYLSLTKKKKNLLFQHVWKG
jgi:hypothetical protein